MTQLWIFHLPLSPDHPRGGDHLYESAKGAGSPAQTRCGPSNWYREMAKCSWLALFLLPCETYINTHF